MKIKKSELILSLAPSTPKTKGNIQEFISTNFLSFDFHPNPWYLPEVDFIVFAFHNPIFYLSVTSSLNSY